MRGNLGQEGLAVAIVGSRRPSGYGISVAESFAQALSQQGFTIISGLALGIDAVAHRACLDAGGHTIAVLAHGLETISPRRNAQLGEQIIASGGALVSEYPVGRHAHKANFIERNRIVAGLADAIIVVEAGERSGTMSTARFGLELGREVLAVPGSIQSVLSRGTNNLIKRGAHPITEVADVFHVLNVEPNSDTSRRFSARTKQEKTLLEALRNNVSSGAELQEICRMESPEFLSLLTTLELESVIRPGGGNTWFLN